ncbi:MAG TPA: outer membrane lipid asymmetry maintenance protein MlaD [Acetobacteraceae bacterium]|jgi:phospholipid/cholesterol/gamma-HCH transport system substrate-binding protein|nr:outer membrane lipid asymmetry maintenance protein MlaD [Acetobacteraceae bacterium]
MARHNAAEVGTGAVVLVLAAGFLAYAVLRSGAAPLGGYPLRATFTSVAGLPVGADVRIAGVKVGTVTAESLNPETFLADVTFTVAHDIQLPRDTSASVASEGLLGSDYLSLDPGGDSVMLKPGGRITATQSAINIESLLGKFIFGSSSSGGTGGSASQPKSAPATSAPSASGNGAGGRP